MIWRLSLALSGWVFFSSMAVAVPVQSWPGNVQDNAAVRNGAWLFVRHCQACHDISGADSERMETLSTTEPQLLNEFVMASGKKDGRLRTAAAPEVLKQAFGVLPPDLALFLRARSTPRISGADWTYSFLRAYYPDPKSPSGWNNLLRPGVAMPNVLQGLPEYALVDRLPEQKFGPSQAGVQDGFDKKVSDLVAYLVLMSGSDHKIGSEAVDDLAGWNLRFAVLIFFGFLLVVVYALKKEYWKGVR